MAEIGRGWRDGKLAAFQLGKRWAGFDFPLCVAAVGYRKAAAAGLVHNDLQRRRAGNRDALRSSGQFTRDIKYIGCVAVPIDHAIIRKSKARQQSAARCPVMPRE